MSMSKEHIQRLVKGGLYAILITVVAYGFVFLKSQIFDSGQFFYLQSFDIQGIKHLTKRDVISLSELTVGSSILDPNLGNIERKIARSPYVKSVSVERVLPSTLKISIVELKPIAYLNMSPIKLLAPDGKLLPRPVELDYPDLPLIHFKGKKELQDGEFLKDKSVLSALNILSQIEIVSVDLTKIISEINISESGAEFLLIRGGAKLVLSEENLSEQLLNLHYFLENNEHMDLLDQLAYIDIRYADRVIIKERKKG